MKYSAASFAEFRCAHCHAMVSGGHGLSGVNNRNHCPYCLWSCHLDLYAAGDRLSACRAPMKPIGLTLKKRRKKYGRDARGELMLIHECGECRALSINRIAADDDSTTVASIFEASIRIERELQTRCGQHGVVLLDAKDRQTVYRQLYGSYGEIPVNNRASPY